MSGVYTKFDRNARLAMQRARWCAWAAGTKTLQPVHIAIGCMLPHDSALPQPDLAVHGRFGAAVMRGFNELAEQDSISVLDLYEKFKGGH